MTRVTNFGRKRAYLEAGFEQQDRSTAPDLQASDHAQQNAPIEPRASSSNAELRPAKKQKKTKDLTAAPSDATAKTETQSTTTGESEAAGGSSVKPGANQPKRPPKRHRSKKGKGPLGFSQVKGKGDAKDAAATSAKDGNDGEKGHSAPLTGWENKKSQLKRPLEDQSKALARSWRDDPREDRRVKRATQKLQETTCFACRERGHAARDCTKPLADPHALEGEAQEDNNTSRAKGGKPAPVVGICYRCGSDKHNLSRCKKPTNDDDPLPFASCFVCSGKGHLAGSCPKNQNKGVYPNGGSCKICGDTTHLAKECGVRRNEVVVKNAVGTGADAGADEDDFMVLKRRARAVEKEEQKEEKLKAIVTASEKAPAGINHALVHKTGPPAAKKVVVF